MVHPDPARIIVPRKHGEILIEPPLTALKKAATESFDTPHAERFFGQPLPALRAAARSHMLQAAINWTTQFGETPPSPDAATDPWIITGHQLEFYHAGVWAKVLAAHTLAAQIPNALAFDILVDHDTLDHHGFDIPLEKDHQWSRIPVEFAPPSRLPVCDLSAPDPQTFEKWDAAIAQFPAAHADSLTAFLASLRRARFPDNSPIPYTRWLSRARTRFERSLNIRIHHVPATHICSGPIWNAFVNAWIQNAPQWAHAYNDHLQTYRHRHGIKGAQHPMPNLQPHELPFWTHTPGNPRERLILTPDFRIQHSKFRIYPRALAFTLFIRLFLADLFIHGIGGALYDQITDALLHDLFAVAPPYACVSAAWLLPQGQALQPAQDLSALRWQRHHAQHNPQQSINPFIALRTEVAELIQTRRRLIDQIAASLAAARHAPPAIAARNAWFQELHQINQSLHAHSPKTLAALDEQIIDALHQRQQNKVLLHREYFFALHTRASLETLIQKIQSA